MKKILVMMMCLLLLLSEWSDMTVIDVKAKESVILVDDKHFPDPVLRRYVITDVDLNRNNKLSSEEIIKITEIDLSDSHLYDTTGIEYFTNLKVLDISGNELKNVNLCKNHALNTLTINGNNSTDLDFSNNQNLETLTIKQVKKPFDISKNVALKRLTLEEIYTQPIDLRGNPNLEYFEIMSYDYGYNLGLDLSQNIHLKKLVLDSWFHEKLDLTKCKELEQLSFRYLDELVYLSEDCNLKSLRVEGGDISNIMGNKMPNLTDFYCNNYSDGDVATFINNNTQLKVIDIQEGSVKDVDFNKFQQLEKLTLGSLDYDDSKQEEYVVDLSKNNLYDLEIYDSDINVFLNYQSNLTSLSLRNVKNQFNFSQYPNIKKLVIENMYDPNNDYKCESIDLMSNKKLTELYLTLGDNELILPMENSIKSLEINGEQDNINYFKLDLKTLKELENLSIWGYIHVDVNCETMPNLKKLELDNCGILSLNLQKNYGLKELYLNNSSGNVDELQIEHLNNLESLIIDDLDIETLNVSSYDTLKTLHLINMRQLFQFDLSKYNVLTDLVIQNTSLKEVNLPRNEHLESISVKGLVMPMFDISGLTSLRSLKIEDSYLRGINIKNTPKLKEFYLSSSTIMELDLTSDNLANMNTGINKYEVSRCEGVVFNFDQTSNNGITGLNDIVCGGTLHVIVNANSFDIKDICPSFDPNRVVNVSGAKMNGSEFCDFSKNGLITYSYLIDTNKNNREVIEVNIHTIDQNSNKNLNFPYTGNAISLSNFDSGCSTFNSDSFDTQWQKKINGEWKDVAESVGIGQYRVKISDKDLEILGLKGKIDWIEFSIIFPNVNLFDTNKEMIFVLLLLLSGVATYILINERRKREK